MIEIIKYVFFDFSHLYNVIEPIAKAAPNTEVLAIKMPENVKNKTTMIVLIKPNLLFTNRKTANIKPILQVTPPPKFVPPSPKPYIRLTP